MLLIWIVIIFQSTMVIRSTGNTTWTQLRSEEYKRRRISKDYDIFRKLYEDFVCPFKYFLLAVIQAFGVDLGARQQVIATATVYFKRFYARYVTD
jgi:hypothetical protein